MSAALRCQILLSGGVDSSVFGKQFVQQRVRSRSGLRKPGVFKVFESYPKFPALFATVSNLPDPRRDF